jgi:hypothetical protein
MPRYIVEQTGWLESFMGDSFGLFPKIGGTDKIKNTLLIFIYVEHHTK